MSKTEIKTKKLGQGVPDHLKAQFFRDLWRDINIYGLDCTILIHGRKRTGKSWLALKILEILNLYKMENIDYVQIILDRVHFRVGKFAQAIGTANEKGMVIILDEAGVDASNMQWWKTTLKNLRDIQHVDGIRHLILIMVLPKMAHLAKSSRDMVNVEIKTIHCDKRKKLTKCIIKHRGFFSTEMDKGVRHRTRSGDTMAATHIGPPSTALTDAYESISRPFKEKIIKEKIDEIVGASEGAEDKKNPYRKDIEIVESIKKEMDKYLSSKNRIKVGLIESDFKVGRRIAERARDVVERDYLSKYISERALGHGKQHSEPPPAT